MQSFFKHEQKFYNKHKDELIEKYLGKQVVIYQNQVRGAFDDFSSAVDFAQKNNFAPNKFMIKKVTKNDPVYEMIPILTQQGKFDE